MVVAGLTETAYTRTTEYLTLGESSWYYAYDYPIEASMPVAVYLLNRIISMGKKMTV